MIDDRHLVCLIPRRSDATVCDVLRAAGWEVHVAADLRCADRLMQQHPFAVGLLVHSVMNDELCTGLDRFLRRHRRMEWVGAFSPAACALPCCRDLIVDHLFDHHTLPFDAQRLLQTLGHARGHAALRQAANVHDGPVPGDRLLAGQSATTQNLLRQIGRLAKVEAPVLIRGESGSGKEVAAQAIHQLSSRSAGPFVPVNCGAMQSSLIQSELFGHVKGAFTGADRDKRGLIEAAQGGTVFLDEIGDLSLQLQINLLRFLQEKTINRVGSTQSVRVDVRVIAATNVELEEAVSVGAFREDLFYRLNVLPLRVPPLRERKPDIAVLAQHFFDKFADEKSPRLKGFSRSALGAMEQYSWPGNVRELINRVRRAMVMGEGGLITPADLGLETDRELPLRQALEDVRTHAERKAIHGSLEQARRNVTQAAKHLGVSRMTLYRLMAKHGIAN